MIAGDAEAFKDVEILAGDRADPDSIRQPQQP
jgi:hypothetical protein